ncbi:MAG TPA: UDP-N-acetylmuramate--L-alanine ligase, partial [Thermodesulfobacteriota bacterium]|nr:UDP-N-acetylmuramate--L-alanine ligase [Thermodesulfobacteriota bacterium]
GVGMSGIAEVLLTLGYRVSGSDLKASETTRRLAALGGEIRIGHDAANVADTVDVVVVSSAVRPTNPEVLAARARRIPVIPRAEMLAELMRLKYGVAVAGSHGKTTTTSMIAAVLAHGGLDPTVVIGGKVNSLGAGARLGQGAFMVVEADESDGSFLKLSPTIAVLTNVDAEHLDHYGSLAALEAAFLAFAAKVPFYGLVVLCADEPPLAALLPKLERRHRTYGLSPQAELRAEAVRCEGLATTFDVVLQGRPLGRVALKVPGVHNAVNALAAVAVGLELDLPWPVVRDALAGFTGVQRRFQVKGEAAGVLVVDDYGHHPTEIRATLAAARAAFGRRTVVAFQPHRFTRTRDCFDRFLTAFGDADVLIGTEIYPAGEEPIEGVSGARLFEAIRAAGHPDVTFVPDRAGLVPALLARLRPGDLALTLGAGDITQVSDALLAALGQEDGSAAAGGRGA